MERPPAEIQEDDEFYRPRLDDAARAWLREAIELVHAGHRWLASID